MRSGRSARQAPDQCAGSHVRTILVWRVPRRGKVHPTFPTVVPDSTRTPTNLTLGRWRVRQAADAAPRRAYVQGVGGPRDGKAARQSAALGQCRRQGGSHATPRGFAEAVCLTCARCRFLAAAHGTHCRKCRVGTHHDARGAAPRPAELPVRAGGARGRAKGAGGGGGRAARAKNAEAGRVRSACTMVYVAPRKCGGGGGGPAARGRAWAAPACKGNPGAAHRGRLRVSATRRCGKS